VCIISSFELGVYFVNSNQNWGAYIEGFGDSHAHWGNIIIFLANVASGKIWVSRVQKAVKNVWDRLFTFFTANYILKIKTVEQYIGIKRRYIGER